MKKKTIELILTAAEKEIAAKGIDGAKIETIARQAGVTKQLIYHYFKNKDQLYRAILDSTSQQISILADLTSYQHLSPDDAIRHFINTLFNDFIEHPSYTAFTLDQALHEGSHISEISSFYPTIRLFIHEVLAPVLARGSEQGIFKPKLNAAVTFWMIFNLVTSCFTNEKNMSETSVIDFNSPQGIDVWRSATIDFTLAGLRA